jgi:hypothetical protein
MISSNHRSCLAFYPIMGNESRQRFNKAGTGPTGKKWRAGSAILFFRMLITPVLLLRYFAFQVPAAIRTAGRGRNKQDQ